MAHKGLIIKSLSGQYTVRTEKQDYICKARGLFRKDDIKPLCGDQVLFDVTSELYKEGYITKILPRKNSLVRPPVANVDRVVVVFSLINPQWDGLLVDLLLLACKSEGVNAVLCLNKSDLSDEEQLKEIIVQYANSGYPIVSASALNKDNLEELKQYIKEGLTVLAGQSGTGKSTLINSLSSEYALETGKLSEKIQRGKNTTRHCELLPFDKGYIADTPGFSKFDPGLLEPKDIATMYNEFLQYSHQCMFNDCIHIDEIGCAVKQAVQDSHINEDRYERYVMIYNMSKEAVRIRRGY